MNIVDRWKGLSAWRVKSTGRMWLLLQLVCIGLLIAGCADTYGPPPAYGPGAPYAGPPPYGPGYPGPGYGPAYPYGGGVAVEIGDRPYYTRGPGYYVGRAYHIWKPGHWTVRKGRKVWIHGHYVVR